ncbi:hypothetical protein [Pseudomonas syringae]|uniref:hypothetical protein n=1 Tax=Pseudomonas syringae TaxID=317 RepID=UPI0015C49C65|nr:hypothetical protein [Pseudomonas syringae]
MSGESGELLFWVQQMLCSRNFGCPAIDSAVPAQRQAIGVKKYMMRYILSAQPMIAD